MDIDSIMDSAAVLAEEMRVQAIAGLNKAKDKMTPGFIQRMKAKKIHEATVADSFGTVDYLHTKVEEVIEDEEAYFAKEREKARRREMKVRKEAFMRDEVKEVLQEAIEVQQAIDYSDYHRRRQLQLDELQRKNDEAQKAIDDAKAKELLELRTWREAHWGNAAVELREEAEELKRNTVIANKMQYKDSIDRIYSEWDERQFARARMQVEVPKTAPKLNLPSGRSLAVFGGGNGKRNNTVGLEEVGDEDGEHEDGLDLREHHLFDNPPQTEYEDRVQSKNEIESVLKRNDTLYNVLGQEVKELDRAVNRMVDMRDAVERDLRQVNVEIGQLDRDLLGPPRRLPFEHEMDSMNFQKDKKSAMVARLEELQHAIQVSDNRKRDIEHQMLEVSRQIAIGRADLKKTSSELDEVNNGFGALPMVVGKSIIKAENIVGTNPNPAIEHTNALVVNPKETRDALIQDSKYYIMKEQSVVALKSHKEVVEIDQNIWVERQGQSDIKLEAERTISRLASISEKIKSYSIETAKKNLVFALKSFHNNNTQLLSSKVVYTGALPWWRERREDLTSKFGTMQPYTDRGALGGISFESPEDDEDEVDELLTYGVSLGEAKAGTICGVVELPKLALWNISLTVSRKGNDEKHAAPDESDHVIVHLGPALTSMNVIGEYHNVVNPETGAVLYDVNYIVHSKRIAYKFEFYSSVLDEDMHLCIPTGAYEEYEMKPLEVIPEKPLKHGRVRTIIRERLLSSYVKMLRVEEGQGKLRLTKIIEELIQAEESKLSYWDSSVLQKYSQRYGRDYFLKILRAEILLEVRKMKTQAQMLNRSALNNESEPHPGSVLAQTGGDELAPGEVHGSGLSADKLKRIQESAMKYLNRRRDGQMHLIEKAKKEIGRRIDIFDDKKNKWRHVIIKGCDIKWVENGIKVLIKHVLQEVDGVNNLVGEPFVANLSKLRYFDSAIQEFDESARMTFSNKLMWMQKLAELSTFVQKSIGEKQAKYQRFNATEMKTFEEDRDRMLEEYEQTIDEKVKRQLQNKNIIRLIRQNIGSALLDMRKGIIKVDETKKPRVQALEVAEARFIKYYKEERYKELLLEIDKRHDRVVRRREARVVALKEYRKNIRKETAKEIKILKYHIEEQKKAEKAAIKARVTFDPIEFAKAVPKASQCEHLKSKAWGNNYATGVRCTICGKELTKLHEEESQIMGYGSGADYQLYLDVKRHRDNEQSFRFKTAQQLKNVEDERIRLEKERREMSMEENYFNDFQDLQVIYEFDQRHAKEIKQAGVFRQGLQWTESELDTFVERQTALEKLRIRKEGLVEETALEHFDPFKMIENPPPTFRAEDERHLSNYREIKYSMGRLHNFQRKIVQLKDERAELLNQRSIFSEILHSLHKGAFTYDLELSELEADLDKTSKLLATYAKMQKLWQHSNRILIQARKDLKKAEMKRVGCWDDVKEAGDELSFLHDETKTLLKVKLLFERRLDTIQKDVEKRTLQLKEIEEQKKSYALAANGLKYCEPGTIVSTRYGDALIRIHRRKDNMLMVTLSFGNPPFKAWIHADEIIHRERAKQQAECILMELEDKASTDVEKKEKNIIRSELAGMRIAEGNVREIFRFEDLGNMEDGLVKKSVQHALYKGYELIQSPVFIKKHKKNVDTLMKKFLEQRKKDHDTYEGPPSGRPPLLSTWQQMKKKKAMANELIESYIEKSVIEAEKKVKNKLYKDRADWLQNHQFDMLIQNTVSEMILDIAQEAITEGRKAKMSAEKASALYVPTPPWMQYSTYFDLTTVWKARKLELKVEIETNKGLASKAEISAAKRDPDEEDEEEKEKRRLRKIARRELKRQARLCAIMDAEEARARKFYHWELLENLRERREMKIQEKISVELAKQPREKIVRKKPKVEKTQEGDSEDNKKIKEGQTDEDGGTDEEEEEEDGVDAITGGGGAENVNFERRRQELKDLTLERRRREEELAHMIIEDKAGELLREIDRAERQKKAYIAEFGEMAEYEDGETHNFDDGEEREFVPGVAVLVPPWMKRLPDDWVDWRQSAQQQYIKIHTDIRAHKKRIRINAEKEARFYNVWEDRSYKEWEMEYARLHQLDLESELQQMMSQELLRERQGELYELRDNIRRVTIFCREKGEIELKSRTRMKQLEMIAQKRDSEVEEAEKWLEICEKRSKHRDKIKRKVTSDCKWVDTSAITGFHQRFRTELLRERLYWVYFNQIVYSVVNRAETIATERMLFSIQEKLSISKAALDDRISCMKKLWRDMQRGELLRMRRSALNKNIFGKARRDTLYASYSSWVRFYYWNRGHREAFNMKYEVIKRRMDLDRQFANQLKGLPAAPTNKDRNGLGPTTMQKHQGRLVQCKCCLQYYLESQNTAISCEYHAGKFLNVCPKSCPNPGLTKMCTAHRRRRWTCCDSTKEMIPGCSRRYHVPVDSDPTYDKIMENVNIRDADLVDGLEGRASNAATQNWPRKAHEINRNQVGSIEDEIEHARNTAERYKDLVF